MNGSKVILHTDTGWAGVDPQGYRDDGGLFLGVVRHTLLTQGRSVPELDFELRYFEVSPGGYTSLERHAHPHAVLVVRGRGTVRLGGRLEEIGILDVVYVAPWEVHRFQADASEALGFVCVVDRDRDRPEPVKEGRKAS